MTAVRGYLAVLGTTALLTATVVVVLLVGSGFAASDPWSDAGGTYSPLERIRVEDDAGGAPPSDAEREAPGDRSGDGDGAPGGGEARDGGDGAGGTPGGRTEEGGSDTGGAPGSDGGGGDSGDGSGGGDTGGGGSPGTPGGGAAGGSEGGGGPGGGGSGGGPGGGTGAPGGGLPLPPLVRPLPPPARGIVGGAPENQPGAGGLR